MEGFWSRARTESRSAESPHIAVSTRNAMDEEVSAVPSTSRSPDPLVPFSRPPQAQEASTLLEYLPLPYQGDPFLGRFLMIIETIYKSIETTIDNEAYYLDPLTCPPEQLNWLASWVGADVDEYMSPRQQRMSILHAAQNYQWHGTRRAIGAAVRTYTGQTPLIVENFDGLRLDQDGALGYNTELGSFREGTFTLTVITSSEESVNPQILSRLIESVKPAHARYVATICVDDDRTHRDEQAVGDGPSVAPWLSRANEITS